MYCLDQPLPKLRRPDIIPADEYRPIADTYRKWVETDLKNKGGSVLFQEFRRLTISLEEMKQRSLQERIKTLLGQPILRTWLSQVHRLEQTLLKDHLPLIELRATIHVLCAQAADAFFRNKITPTALEIDLSARHFGMRSLEAVEEAYKVACGKYSHCCLTLVGNHLRVTPDQSMRIYDVLYDKWFIGYLDALCHCLLMKFAKRLKTIAPETRLTTSTCAEVLPYLVIRQDLRLAIDKQAIELISHVSLEHFLRQPMNEPKSGYLAFRHLATLGAIVGDMRYARMSLKIARGFAQNDERLELEEHEQLIQTLEPSVHA